MYNHLNNMGTYGISGDEVLDGIMHAGEIITFEDFLQGLEGDVSAEAVAEAWNKLAKEHKWDDKLKAINPKG